MPLVSGAVYIHEFQYIDSNRLPDGSFIWNVHCHALWLCPWPPKRADLSRLWREITGGQWNVDVRGLDGYRREDTGGVSASVRQNCFNVLAYACKRAKMPREARWHLHRALNGRGRGKSLRSLAPFGLLWGKQASEDDARPPRQDGVAPRRFWWDDGRYVEL